MSGFVYRKLPHGPWGVMTDEANHKAGETVRVTTKSGKQKEEVLGERIYSVGTLDVFLLDRADAQRDAA